MKNSNWAKYSDESLEFVLQEATKMLKETFKSFREAGNKAFLALAFYIGFVSYCFNQIITQTKISISSLPYVLMTFGLLIAVLKLWPNLMPRKMNLQGSKPSILISEYFEQEQFKERQKREMVITKIIDYENAISNNISQAVERAKCLKQSAKIFLIFLCLSLAIGVLSRMCLN